ncbi:protein translocase subunit SecDF [Siccirubricoccus deserti]|uniref:Multifunctional fusion protein n=1 Tax=Siccirubricoccus deserti TaxID=2013562 RepID=A0A9X0QZ68_9PROT|nr:protein translocase subunit SecD [Siccirubricoccus deserti]MBC4016580.1 protein translocase subunit SecD [Siccirubricoccus deserti]GGC50196.1 protein translocase subunit SecDF [Siccirubricoccus deserti]
MMFFARWKTTAILAVCLLGILLCLPNLFPKAELPGWARQFSLGLDLRGGSYLLLEVDMNAVVRERLESLADAARTRLRQQNIGYVNLAADAPGRRVTFRVRDPGQAAAAAAVMREQANQIPTGVGTTTPDIEVAAAPDGTISATLTEVGLRAKATGAVEQSIEIVRRRIDETGVAEALIARQGQNRILVQLPGVEDPARIKDLLGKTARMTFHLLDETANPFAATPPPGVMFLAAEQPTTGQPERYAVRRRVEVDGANLTDARAGQDSRTGEWVVNFTFDSIGTRRFAEVTRQNVGRPFAIVLDEKVITAPNIREPITGGRGQISGSFTARTANELSVLLRAGALPAPLTVVEERTVGPELGADAIRAGVLALAAGVVFVFLYMGLAYGLFGWFANIALLVNIILLLAALSVMEATLTLPGIAGIVLTLGTALDANILINERIREEVKNGRPPLSALEAGFTKASGTIMDSNLTNLIAMACLYGFGSGPVKGFAVTVAIGTVAQMWTATTLVRLMVSWWYRAKRPKELPVLGRGRGLFGWLSRPLFRLVPDVTTVPFMKGARVGLMVSALLSTASLIGAFYPGLENGVDFKGGIVMEVRTPGPANLAQIRASIAGLNLGDVGVQEFGSPDTVLVRLPVQGDEAGTQRAVNAVRGGLEQVAPGTRILRVEAVGNRVSDELFLGGMIALGISLLAMLIYIWFRFEWQFAIAAIITLILDTTKTVGFMVLFGVEFNLTTVAAILTVIGFSANDKVVVFDRMRENLRKYKQMPLRQLVDQSINETLNRSLGTSMTLLLAAVPLAIFGGDTLSGFAWVMLFGIVVSASSSVFIAAPIVLYSGEGKLRRGEVAKPASAPGKAGAPAGV